MIAMASVFHLKFMKLMVTILLLNVIYVTLAKNQNLFQTSFPNIERERWKNTLEGIKKGTSSMPITSTSKQELLEKYFPQVQNVLSTENFPRSPRSIKGRKQRKKLLNLKALPSIPEKMQLSTPVSRLQNDEIFVTRTPSELEEKENVTPKEGFQSAGKPTGREKEDKSPSRLQRCGAYLFTNCYMVSDFDMSWSEAHSYCRTFGGFLPDLKQLEMLKQQKEGALSNLTWSALGHVSGCLQWLTRIPAYLEKSLWIYEEMPFPWDKRCPAFNFEKSNFVPIDCSHQLKFACIKEEEIEKGSNKAVELHMTANLPDQDEWIEVDENAFRGLTLECTARESDTKRKLPRNVFWSMDGIWLNHDSSVLQPGSTDVITKNFYRLPTSMSSDLLVLGKQGTYCCESWVSHSTDIIRSNCFLVTLKNYTAVIANLKFKNFFSGTSFNSVDIHNFVRNETLLLFKENLSQISTNVQVLISASKTYSEDGEEIYEFIVRIFTKELSRLSTQKINKMMSDLKQNITTNEHGSKYLHSQSVISLATYCTRTTMDFDYGNSINFDFSKSGQRYPSYMKCEVADGKLEYPICRWNFTYGARVITPKSCLRFDACPVGYSVVGGKVCVKYLKNISWEEGFREFYKLGDEISLLEEDNYFLGGKDSIYSYVTKHAIDSGITTVWLLAKRLYVKSPIINYSRNSKVNIRNFEISSHKFRFTWRIGHPLADHDCVSIDLTLNELFSLRCSQKNNFVIFIDLRKLSQLFEDQRINTKRQINDNKSTNICEKDWILLPSVKGGKFCAKEVVSSTSSWDKANELCHLEGAELLSPYKGFRNWYYMNYVSKTPTWINFGNYQEITKYDYLNWHPNADFSQKYGVMDNNGWFLVNSSKEINSFICESPMKFINRTQIILEKYPKSHVLCINIIGISDFQMLKCFSNGFPINYLESNTSDCPRKLPLSFQGYYECHMWQDASSSQIQSNTFLYTKSNLTQFAVYGYEIGKSYYPHVHDSTFFSRESSRFQEVCMKKIASYIFDREDLGIPSVMFFERSEIFHYFFIIECLSSKCITYEDMELYLENLKEDSDFKKHCSILEIRGTSGCFSDTSEDQFGIFKNVTWPETNGAGNQIPLEPCMDNEGKLITRTCSGNFLEGFYWEPAPDGCLMIPSNRTNNIWKIANDPEGYVNGNYDLLSEWTKDSDSLLPSDLHYVTNAMESLSNNQNLTKKMKFSDVVYTMNNVLGITNKTQKLVYEFSNCSAKLLETFEKLAFAIDEEDSATEGRKCAFSDKIWADCVDVSQNESIIGFKSNQLNSDFLTKNKIDIKNADVAILLPENLIQDVIVDDENEDHNQVLFVVYREDKIFFDKERDSQGYKINSQVIQTTIENTVVENLEKGVKIFFKPKRNQKANSCVFWDTRKNNFKGGWSDQGCILLEATSTLVSCECNHLSIFALLMKFSDEKFDKMGRKNEMALQFISTIGCIMSIMGLGLVLVSFVLFRKWRKPLSNQILANLSLAILMSLLLFLFGLHQIWNKIICRGVAVTLHYFISASFGWMLVEGVHQYLRFVKVVGTYIPRFMWKAMVCAWGIPILPIVVILVYDSNLYEDGTRDDICWMSSTIFLYCFVPTVAIILFINFIIFVRIIDNVIIRRRTIASTMKKGELLISQLGMSVSIFLLMGFTWIFGLLTFSDGTMIIFAYLFCILNTLQGFMIFLFHICRDRSSRHLWHDFLLALDRRPSSKMYSSSSNTLGSTFKSRTWSKSNKSQSRRFHSRKSLNSSVKTTKA